MGGSPGRDATAADQELGRQKPCRHFRGLEKAALQVGDREVQAASYRCPTELSPGQTQVPKLEPQREGHFSCLSYYAPWVRVQPMFSNPRTLVQPKLSGI